MFSRVFLLFSVTVSASVCAMQTMTHEQRILRIDVHTLRLLNALTGKQLGERELPQVSTRGLPYEIKALNNRYGVLLYRHAEGMLAFHVCKLDDPALSSAACIILPGLTAAELQDNPQFGVEFVRPLKDLTQVQITKNGVGLVAVNIP